ncbi:ABC transporter [Burkholderia stagnalis]|uniref:Membrane integrity-associated transporter subunit PqiC n=2 Tax=Burkholderia stagnalis TaxID=1503054 RepID=A0A6L3MM37_9BURK|nr:ABC-type transport auxiliary lipoprotein family protein [Burkholderia stagnalis]KAB0632057.1 membrane integrity-associated transporter subunit PqiC [Burkholderia stagnalis]KVO44613.1 ABC transporter [Burkholderia stagnalis]KVO76654.1 ABC transporter [Burkholderia stagnalis]KVW56007.1 ABC transporter [Burkholderia stagnalis]KVW82075.1 ABC transporter [Burkholderia stagnalis]
MSRTLARALRPAAAALAALALTLAAGCASERAAQSNIRYDLGPAASTATAGTGPALKVLDVAAPDALDSDKFVYRLAYADAQRTAVYRDSRWTAPPAQLLTQRLRSALSSRGAVLEGSDGVRAPTLKIDLNEFEQVFDGESQSHGAVTARATLTLDGKVLGQRTFVARAPSSTPDAAGGARALATASDDLVAQIAAWVGMRAYAGTP